MKDEDVTAQILSAWEEIEEEDAAEAEAVAAPPGEAEPEPDEEESGEREQEDEEGEEGEEAEEGEQAEPEEEAEEPEVEEPPAPQFEDVEVQAFLSKYGGEIEKALKGGAELQRLIERQGQEKNEAIKRAEQLEARLVQAQAFGGGGGFLSEEQREWVEGAAESGNPGAFVQQAMQAGEFELARAVCREWAQNNPFEATRAGQFVDATEYQLREQQAQPEPVPPATTWQALSSSYPELRTYEEQMVTTLGRLGPDHPLVQEARSTDPQVAVRGIFGIYEIAKASTFALSETRDGLKRKRSKEADAAVDNAVVTSASTAPSVNGTPRRRDLMPGLTQEDFDRAFQ